MSQPSNIQAHLVADEASFGAETATFDERPQVVGGIDPSGLTQERIPLDLIRQYANEGHWGARGPYGGSFDLTMYLPGHGADTTGAITANAQETLLSRAIGAIDVTQAGTTVNVGTSATQWSATGGTQTDGAVGFLGVIGDARGNGQAFVTDNAVTMTSLVAMDATPSGSDSIRAASNIYPIETSANDTLVTTRHQFLSGNQRYNCYGCFPTNIALSGLNPGELPQVTLTYGVSYWQAENSATFPTATSMTTHVPNSVGGGSFHMSDVGTSTRTLFTARDVQVNMALTTIPLVGPGMANARQIITGARRVGIRTTISFTVDAEAAGTDTLGDLWNDGDPTWKQILYTVSPSEGTGVDQGKVGTSLALWFPNCKPVDQRPVQFDDGGINRMRITMEAHTSQDSTSALTHASFIIAQG